MLSQRLFGEGAGVVNERRFRLLLGANMMAILGSSLISPILDSLTGTFGVSSAEIGLMVTALTAPSIVLIPASGILTDRYGRKRILVAGLTLFGVSGTLVSLTTDFRFVLLLRLLQGVGFAGTIPVIIISLGDLYTGPREATAQGLRLSTSGLSMAVFPIAGSILVVFAWQLPFLLYALALLPAAGIYYWLDEPTGNEEQVNSPEPDGGQESDDGDYWRDLRGLVGKRRTILLLVARTLLPVVFYLFLTYNSIVVSRVLDGSPQVAGALVALYNLASAGAGTQSGRVTDITDTRTWPLVAAFVCMGAGIPAFAFAPSTTVAAAAVFVVGIGNGTAAALFRSLFATLPPERLRGGFVSLGEATGRAAGTVTPIVVGLALATFEGALGPVSALQWTVAITGAIGGGLGALSMFLTGRAPPALRKGEL